MSRIRPVLPWLVAAVILALLFARVDLEATLAALGTADLYAYTPIAVVFTVLWLALDAFVLRAVFARVGATLSFREMVLARAATYPWMVLSFDLSNAALVAGLRRSSGVPVASLAAAMLAHYACDLVALATVAAVGAVASEGAFAAVLRPMLIGLALVAAGILVSARMGVARFGRGRLADAVRAFRPRDLARVVALRWLFYASFALFVWLTLPCFALDVPFLAVLARMPVVQSIAALPISPGGIGTAQAAMVALFSGFGPASSWLAYSLVYSLTLVLLRLPIGFAAWGGRASSAGERKTLQLLVLALVFVAGCSVPVPFADDLLFSLDRPQLPVSEDCRRCHGEVVEEWSDSPHAGAWTSPRFAALTADHAAEACLGCHAPAPIGREGEIALRSDHREEGVTCISCHLMPDSAPLTMRGPHARTSPVEVHPIEVDPLFTKPDLCGTCHAEVLEQFRAAPAPADGSEKEICQGCHMPAVRRTIESYDTSRPYSRVLVALGKPVAGRRHRFGVPLEPWEDIDLDSRREADRWIVRVRNKLPHALPTGAFGQREVRLRAGDQVIRLRADLDQAIPAGEERGFELAAGASAEVVLERRNPRTGAYERLAPAPPEAEK